jgi:hypothetical protein
VLKEPNIHVFFLFTCQYQKNSLIIGHAKKSFRMSKLHFFSLSFWTCYKESTSNRGQTHHPWQLNMWLHLLARVTNRRNSWFRTSGFFFFCMFLHIQSPWGKLIAFQPWLQIMDSSNPCILVVRLSKRHPLRHVWVQSLRNFFWSDFDFWTLLQV